jgi:Rad3-related DNA helicase
VILPTWAPTLYPTQVKAIQESISAFNDGANIVQLDAPTGSGKTLIAYLLHQSLGARTLYLCSSLQLQTQFTKDFPDGKLIQGRSNYPTGDSPSRYPELTAGDCTKERTQLPACSDCTDNEPSSLHCRWCHPVRDCPYETAKREAVRANLVCANISYFLYESNYVGNLPLRRTLVVVDEADCLEDALLSFVQVHISKRRCRELGITAPDKRTVESSWIDWASSTEQIVRAIPCHGDSIRQIRKRIALTRLGDDLHRLNDPDTGLATGGWIYSGYDAGDITFKPIRVDHLAHQYLWRHCNRWLLMSATTISFQIQADVLGMEK